MDSRLSKIPPKTLPDNLECGGDLTPASTEICGIWVTEALPNGTNLPPLWIKAPQPTLQHRRCGQGKAPLSQYVKNAARVELSAQVPGNHRQESTALGFDVAAPLCRRTPKPVTDSTMSSNAASILSSSSGSIA